MPPPYFYGTGILCAARVLRRVPRLRLRLLIRATIRRSRTRLRPPTRRLRTVRPRPSPSRRPRSAWRRASQRDRVSDGAVRASRRRDQHPLRLGLDSQPSAAARIHPEIGPRQPGLTRRLRRRRARRRHRVAASSIGGSTTQGVVHLTDNPESVPPQYRKPAAADRPRRRIVKVGVALNMLTKEGRSDAEVFAEHMALGDLAEPLGFDSLWALEHHFTGYAMSPSPTQLLSYYAGRTKRVTLGTVRDRPALARPRARGRADRAARRDVGRALHLRVRPRRGQRRVRGLPHPDGGGAPALRRGGADRRQGADQ